MRVLLLTLTLVAAAVGQSTIAPTIAVSDENGKAVSSARVFLQSSSLPEVRCETDFTGGCHFPSLSAGQYQLRVEKEGFYAAVESNVQIAPGQTIEVTLLHQQEAREVVNVRESPAIDPAQVSAQETISGLDVLNIVYPATNDYRNVLNFIPGVVQDQSGQPHVAGAETYQTVTLLDGFNVTQPANGQLLIRVSTDAFRNIQVQPAREPAEDGKGSGGVLALNTGMGDEHYRFNATDFIPSVQDKHGWRFDQFLPRITFSGPIEKGKIWFDNAFDGEYDNIIFTELPMGADNDHVLRLGNLTKLQVNLTPRNILTLSFLPNYLHNQYDGLSPLSPQLSNPKDEESIFVTSAKDQHYFNSGELLESGFAFDQYNVALTPYGDSPYFVNTGAAATSTMPAVLATAGGSYYLAESTRARRWQAIANLFLPPHQWRGRHDFKVGIDLDRISYEAQFERQPISFLVGTNQLASSSAECLTAVQNTNFPCARYSTFSPAPLHDEYNAEVSAYAEDRWSITNRLLLNPGFRLDWDEIIRHTAVAPRLAGTYVFDNSGNTKFSAGIGLVYDATPIFLVGRPFAGKRQDTFYSVNPNCETPFACVTTTGPINTIFSADTSTLEVPRSLNWSLGLEKKLPAAIYMKAEFLEKRGTRGFVYNTLNDTPGGNFFLENTRDDRYDALQLTLRHNFRESYTIMAAYTRSSTHSNQVLDFNVDSNLFSPQKAGPYPWDTPNRFLSWGYLPFFKLPIIHQLEVAYSAEARTGFPFSLLNDQQQLVSPVGAERFPDYFSLNLQLEKRFHLFGYYLALRGGFDNITGRCNPYVVDSVIVNSTNPNLNHPTPTFSACEGRAFTSRIRLLGRK